MENSDILDFFFETGHIPINRGTVFDDRPVNNGIHFEDVRGMMLGLAIGDSLGAPSEGMLPDKRRSEYGDIRNYQPNRADGRRVGIPTDDSQMAFWTLEQMLEDGGFHPEKTADRFCQDRIYGIGGSVRDFIRNYKERDEAWFIAGAESAGNGAMMRIAPMVIPHLNEPEGLWADTALSAMITHRDSASISSCLAFVGMLWEVLQRDAAPEPHWWADQYVQAARDLEIDDTHRPREGQIDFRGTVNAFVDRYVFDAYQDGLSVIEASNYWYSGAYLLETVPTAIYILMIHGDDPEEAIVRAVTDTKDNDTVAAIVGAAVGALHGEKALPSRWVSDLTGRTMATDDGMMFELIDSVERAWAESAQ